MLQRPEAARELFTRIGRAANGFPNEACIDAALNLLMNAIRGGAKNWREAEAVYDEWTAKAKGVLRTHYDHVGGRRSVFAFDQVVGFDRHIDKDLGQGD
jgi:hypothetical protein